MPKTLEEISFLININEWDALTEEDCGYFLEVNMPKTLKEITFLININEWDALTEEDCGYFLEALKRIGPETKQVVEKIEKKISEEMEEDAIET